MLKKAKHKIKDREKFLSRREPALSAWDIKEKIDPNNGANWCGENVPMFLEEIQQRGR